MTTCTDRWLASKWGSSPGPPLPTGGTQGDVLYHDGTSWVRLAAGVSGQALQTKGPGEDPVWETLVSASTIIVSSASELPALVEAPDGVMRSPLAEDTIYIATTTFVWPRLWLPRSTDPTTFVFTEIKTARLGIAILIDGDETPHVWGREVGGVSLDSNQWVDIGNGFAGRSTVLFDVTGGFGVSLWRMFFMQFVRFKGLGQLLDLPLQVSQTNWQDCESGFVVRISPNYFGSHFAQGIRAQQNPGAAAMVKPVLCLQGNPVTTSLSAGNVFLNADDAFLCISSGATGEYDILGNSYAGTPSGDFFRPDVAASLIEMEPADITIDSFEDSTEDPGVDTTLNVSAYTGLTVGQSVLISGGGTVAGLRTITRVDVTERKIDVDAPFNTDTVGAFKLTKITTSGTHPIVANEQVTISGTTSYNDTVSTVFADDDSITVPIAFVADDATGSAATVSLNTKSVGVNADNNGDLRNSRRLAVGRMNGNALATTIAVADTYQALNLGTLLDADETERFTLIDATAGIYRYDDPRPLEPGLNAQITATKGGNMRDYRFSLSVNGAIPDFATAFYAPMEVKTTKVSTSPTGITPIVKDDTIQIMVAAEGHTDSMTITDIGIIIKG